MEEQMKSERMKTELITNVSHDIKTPDLHCELRGPAAKAHTPRRGSQYLEVLARQSQRLKKLTEDLVEMSKAPPATFR